MKTTKIILFIITLWVLWGIKENLSALPASTQSNSLLVWLLNATSLFTYLILFGISFLLYRLVNTYNEKRFFDNRSVSLVRKIGFSVLCLAILDVSNRTLFDYFTKVSTSLKTALLDFFWRIIFVSPTFLFCSILIFILADFMKKAITVKAENESFI